MTYLFKLSRRSAAAVAAWVLPLVLLACSEAAPREFLSPDPNGPPPSSSAPVALVVAGTASTLPYDQSFLFQAWGRLASGDSVPVAVNWVASAGQISPDGRYRGTVPGSHTVTAYAVASPSLSATSRIDVSNPGPLFATLEVQPKPVQIAGGARVMFGATARLQSGANTLPTVTWRATGGGTVAPNGEFAAGLVPGTYLVIATTLDGLLSDTARVVIEEAALAQLQLQPKVITLPGGGSQEFQISAAWTDGTAEVPALEWESPAGTVEMLAGAAGAAGGPQATPGGARSARFTANTEPGNYKVVVKHRGSGKSDTASVTITPVLTAVEVTPASISLLPGATAAFSAKGRMSDGVQTNVSVSWVATGGTISGSGVYVAGGVPGTYRVIGRLATGTLADTSVVQIAAPAAATLTGLTITPATGTVPVGGSVNFTAGATWSDGSTALPALTWTAQAGSVSAQGKWTAPATAGSYRVIVRHSGGTLADTATYSVVVPPPAVTAISVSPKTPGVQGGEILDFQAQAQWSDGSTTLPAVTWAATGGEYNQSGRWRAPNVSGVYRVEVRADDSGLADTAVVTVAETPWVTSVRVSPRLGALNPGGSVQLTPEFTWSDGQVREVAQTWTATGGTVSMSGLFTAGSLAGQFLVIASCAGCTVADTARFSITEPVVPPPTVTQLVLNPATVSVTAGATQAFQVAAAWSDGSTTVPPLAWTAAGGTMSGLTYTAGTTAGTYTVIVRDAGGTKADTSVVTVTAAQGSTPASLVISPDSVSMQSGFSTAFSVSGVSSTGAPITPQVTWSATGGTITPAGVYTAGTASGVYRVVAACVGCPLADTAVVVIGSVSQPPPPQLPPSAGDRVTFPSAEVEFIVGPQLVAGSSQNPWPWYDQNMVTRGLVHGAAFPASAAGQDWSNVYFNLNYYDLGLALYTAYYRTGNQTLLTHARKVADSWWGSLPANGTYQDWDNTWAPRLSSMGGLMLRALDGKPQMWPWITTYVRTQFDVWVGMRLNKAELHYGVRDGGYMLLYAAWLAKVHPDPVVRAEFRQKALDGATLYYARLQYPDGSWRWTDPSASVSGYLMQPFMVGLLLDGMVATHRLTGDPRILTAITRSVENLYTMGYRGNEPVSQLAGATWRGMWYTVYGATCQSGCGRTTLDGGWDTNGIREVRQLNPVIIHAFGYAYAMTQDVRYRQWGDELFAATFGKGNGPLTDAFYGLADFREKEYNASYRSSGHYLAWRQGTP
ncbi:MAG: hypothetical protein KJZ47_02810 [Gemmatimonadales bacterium]|nr:hypothetical protein [Gemmatimonadales bacterium]